MRRSSFARESLFGPQRRTRLYRGFFFKAAALILAAIFLLWMVKDVAGFYLALLDARRAIDRGEYAQARSSFERAWRIRPEHAYVYDGAGFLFVREQGPEWARQARENYEKALEMGLKRNPFVNHTKEARRYLDQGRYGQAEAELEQALRISPLDSESNLLQGHLYYAKKMLEKSIDQYQKALNLAPRSKEAQSALRRAREAKSRESIPYILDRHGQVLAASHVATGLPEYPCSFWAAHVVGYRSKKHGTAGIEKALEEYLTGNTVTLTIDANLQRIAETALGGQMGAVVILKPQTGEILASVSHPTYRPNLIDQAWWKYKSNPNNPLKNRAFESRYEPGSIVKIISAAAIIESKTDISRVFPFRCRGHMNIRDQVFWDWMAHRTVNSFTDAFNQSCNIAYARMAPLVGAATLTQYLRSFGFGEHFRPTLALPVADSSAPGAFEGPYQLAQTFIGLGKQFRVTPIHAAMIAAAIANGGVMMSPTLVKEIRSVTGKVITGNSPKVYKICVKKDTAATLTKHMIDFVQSGIGKKARMIRYHVAGKTGTSGDSSDRLHAWFICFAPAEKPELALAVICEKGGRGHGVAAPIARNILVKAFQ